MCKTISSTQKGLKGSTLTHDSKEVVYNFSSYVLSETEKALLVKD